MRDGVLGMHYTSATHAVSTQLEVVGGDLEELGAGAMDGHADGAD